MFPMFATGMPLGSSQALKGRCREAGYNQRPAETLMARRRTAKPRPGAS